MQPAIDEGIGSWHRYEFARRDWMPRGDCLYPLEEAPGMADVVVSYSPAASETTYHHTVRLPAELVVGQLRPDVLATARVFCEG